MGGLVPSPPRDMDLVKNFKFYVFGASTLFYEDALARRGSASPRFPTRSARVALRVGERDAAPGRRVGAPSFYYKYKFVGCIWWLC